VSVLSQCDLAWRRSSRTNGECVEVAASGGRVLVRDSKAAAGPVLAFPARAWAAFACGTGAPREASAREARSASRGDSR
jgi:hypothetical protein